MVIFFFFQCSNRNVLGKKQHASDSNVLLLKAHHSLSNTVNMHLHKLGSEAEETNSERPRHLIFSQQQYAKARHEEIKGEVLGCLLYWHRPQAKTEHFRKRNHKTVEASHIIAKSKEGHCIWHPYEPMWRWKFVVTTLKYNQLSTYIKGRKTGNNKWHDTIDGKEKERYRVHLLLFICCALFNVQSNASFLSFLFLRRT